MANTAQPKRFQNNGFWEASRMMLPEHKEALQQYLQKTKIKQRKELDEQEWEDVSRVVAASLKARKIAVIEMYHQYEDLQIVGVVDRIDRLAGQFMVDGEWFKIKDIQGAILD
ncbi:YolD-like family protein [Paenibacillus sp. IITD108]|uniref:YolD-like family protein n=1 Tax=Paenibacillus sp. IITD108 TaxID=3116649 RepID=UPI002F3E5A1B